MYETHKINVTWKLLLDGAGDKCESKSEINVGPRFLWSFMVTQSIDKWLGLRIPSQGLKSAAI